MTRAISAGGTRVPCRSGGVDASMAGVPMALGSTTLQRTPSGSPSLATTRAKAISAALDAQ